MDLNAGTEKCYEFAADADSLRLDIFLAGRLHDVSRSYIQNLIKAGKITCNGKAARSGREVRQGDIIAVCMPEPLALQVSPQPMELNILYEDSDIIVVDKPQGMVVHPSPGHSEGTLVNALLHHCTDLSGINGIMRPGIVHRIDKDTFGVLVVAKNDRAHMGLASGWSKSSVLRVYQGLVSGRMKEQSGVIDLPIARSKKNRLKMAVDTENGRQAVTHYQVLKRFKEYTFLEIKLDTGRTHQIRVHAQYIGHPIAGDLLYGFKTKGLPLKGQFLHARTLGFYHPISREWMEFTSALPLDFQEILERLEA